MSRRRSIDSFESEVRDLVETLGGPHTPIQEWTIEFATFKKAQAFKFKVYRYVTALAMFGKELKVEGGRLKTSAKIGEAARGAELVAEGERWEQVVRSFRMFYMMQTVEVESRGRLMLRPKERAYEEEVDLRAQLARMQEIARTSVQLDNERKERTRVAEREKEREVHMGSVANPNSVSTPPTNLSRLYGTDELDEEGPKQG